MNLKAKQEVFNFVIKAKSAQQGITKLVLIKLGERLHYYSVIGEPLYWKHKPHAGYAPGHFINNWQLGVDMSPMGEIPGVDPSGQASLQRMKASVPRYPMGHSFSFVNNVPYAMLLELGHHSLQTPPGGMVGRTVMEFQQIVREAELEWIRSN